MARRIALLLCAVALLGVRIPAEQGRAAHGGALPEGTAALIAPAFDAPATRRDGPRHVKVADASGSAREPGFRFTRAVYSAGWRSRWATDYPKSDRQFAAVLARLTNVDVSPDENAVRLDDPELRRYPFLYLIEPGTMSMTPAEVAGLRSYLDAGGFLVVDDFWGTREWSNFEREMSRVFPDRPIVELPLEHPIFSIFYRVEEIIQVPAVNRAAGPTHEQDGYVPHVRGIFDDDGRLAVIINWNTDLGDAWEWAEQPYYPLRYSTYAFRMGVNMVVYALSH